MPSSYKKCRTKKEALLGELRIFPTSNQVYKPISVEDDHLSGHRVADGVLATYHGTKEHFILSPLGLAPGGVYIAEKSPVRWWALTPPFHPYLLRGGIFLLHYPWSHLHWVLPSTLAHGVRTFLIPCGTRSPNLVVLFYYYTISSARFCMRLRRSLVSCSFSPDRCER